MLTLHGFAYSNYYNIVKHVLLYKSIPFKEDKQYGGTDDYLELSPAGKIPSLTTAKGVHLSESSVCCDYLEDAYPVVPLYPANSIARAQVRQVMKISELYLELPARRLIPFMFTKADVPEPIAQDVRGVIERGVGALNRLCTIEPYLMGAELTMADIYLRYVMNVVDMAGAAKLDWDIGADIEGLKDWQALMADSEISQQVDADREANREEFFAYVQKSMGS